MAFETFRNFFMGSDSDYYYEEEEAPEEQYAVSYTHLRAHETDSYLVCRLLLEKKKKPL